MFTELIKMLKPPYSLRNLPAVLAVFALLLTIPIISLNVINTRDPGSQAATAPTSANCPTLPGAGDVDQDGDVDSVDVLKVLNHASGTGTKLTGETLKRANVNDDTAVNGADANLINRYSGSVDKYLAVCIDHDKDGFSDSAEFYIGTDPYDNCPDSSTDAAWPPDFDNNGRVEQKDIDTYNTPVRRYNTSPGDSGFNVRWDVVPGQGYFGYGTTQKYISSPDINKAFSGGRLNSSCIQGLAPRVAIAVSKTSIYAGESAVLTWSSSNANPPCIASGDWSGQKENSGSFTSPIHTTVKTYNYTLECYGAGGKDIQTARIEVKNPSPDKLPNGRLYQKNGEQTVYVMQNNQKRSVGSEAVMVKCRYKWPNSNDATTNTYLPYVPTNNSPLTTSSTCPSVETTSKYQCTGTPIMNHIDPVGVATINQGGYIRTRATGLSDCANYDKVVLMGWVNNQWTLEGGSCTLGSGTQCEFVWDVNYNPGDYPIKVTVDKDSNGTLDQTSDYKWLKVVPNAPPPPPPPPPSSGIDPWFSKPLNCQIYRTSQEGAYGPGHYAEDMNCTGGGSGHGIYSVSTGLVLEAGYTDDGCGYRVRVRTIASNGDKYIFKYCHMIGAPAVGIGWNISAGQHIGNVGQTGYATGPHLHLCSSKNQANENCTQTGNNIDPGTIVTGVP